MTDFLVYDVFTDTAFGGNPLAVIPDATGLGDDQLRNITREFNFSETTFVYPPEDPANTARVRIFTPSQEIPFAGHPTIGTAIALSELGRGGAQMVLELGVGPIACTVDNGKARFVTQVPLTTWDGPPTDVIAACIGQSQDAVRTDTHPPVIASVGLPFAIAELKDASTLAAARPMPDAFLAFEPQWPTTSHFDLLVYVRDGAHIRARMFAPLDGIPEDPATGSAAAALAAFLGTHENRSQRFEITQGVEMGRPSQIAAEVTVANGKSTAVAIEGRAVCTMQGRLTL